MCVCAHIQQSNQETLISPPDDGVADGAGVVPSDVTDLSLGVGDATAAMVDGTNLSMSPASLSTVTSGDAFSVEYLTFPSDLVVANGVASGTVEDTGSVTSA